MGISKITQLTPATISNLTSECIKEGILIETDFVQQQGKAGRKEILLDVNPQGKYVVGVHIGRKIVSCSLVNLKGTILQRQDQISDHFSVEQTVSLIEDFVSGLSISRKLIMGVSLGVNGWVDFFSGTIRRRPDQRWAGVPLVQLVEEKLGIPAVMDNNVATMALAEKLLGLAKPLNNMLYLYADTGVGAGLIINGVPYRFGPVGVGHISIHQGSEKCWCGSSGCVELFSGADYVQTRARKLAPHLFNHEKMDMLELVQHEHDASLVPLFHEVGVSLGVGLTNALNVLSVENVIVCGHVFESEIVWNELNRMVSERVMAGPHAVSIEKSSYRVNDVGLIGAGSLGIYHFALVGGLPGMEHELIPYI